MKKILSAALLLCFLFAGCAPASPLPPDDPDDTAENAPPVSEEPPAESVPEPPVQNETKPEKLPQADPLPLPVSDGIDWNAAPSQKVGCGGAAPAGQNPPIYSYGISSFSEYIPVSQPEVPDENGVMLWCDSIRITGLRNQILQKRLNELIDTRLQELCSLPMPMTAAEIAETAQNYGGGTGYIHRSVYAGAQISGRVLSLYFQQADSLQCQLINGSSTYRDLGSSQEWLMFDMYDGRQLELADLFYDGADYVTVIDREISRTLSLGGQLKRPFRGLPDDYPYVCAESDSLRIQFPDDNPYVSGGWQCVIGFEELSPICSVLFEDPSPYLLEEVEVYRYARTRTLCAEPHPLQAAAHEFEYPIYSPRFIGGASDEALDAINAVLDAHETRYATLDYLPDAFAESWASRESGNLFLEYYSHTHFVTVQYSTAIYGLSDMKNYSECLTFDLRTGKRVTAADVLLPSEELTAFLAENGITAPLGSFDSIQITWDFSVMLPLPDSPGNVTFVPPDHFNHAFLEGDPQ